jgi:predicted negative regulator of RcsB-dependent stress response
MLMEANGQYQQVLAAFGKNDLPTVVRLADQLASTHPRTGYAEQAQLAAARMQVENNQLPAALDRLQKVEAGTSDPELALVVRLRIARLQIEQNRIDDALKTLSAVEPGAFAGRFAEVRGDALLAKGDRAGALKAYREAQTSQSAQAGPGAGDLLALKINELTRS